MTLFLQAMKDYPFIFKKDCLISKNNDEGMNGVETTFELRTYEQRCNNWYPLLSEYDPDLGITKKGVSFLRFHFVQKLDHKGVVNLMPVRDRLEVFPKIYFAKQKYDDPSKRLMQLKQLAFFCPIWTKEYQVLRNLHDDYLKMKWPQIGDTKTRVFNHKLEGRLQSDFNYWFGHVDDVSFLEVFPSQDYIFQFFMDKPIKEVFDDDDRSLIIESGYREYKPKVVWDLIRTRKVPYDVGGCYPRNWSTRLRDRQLKNKKTVERVMPKSFALVLNKQLNHFEERLKNMKKTGKRIVV